MTKAGEWYQDSYARLGSAAQRRYPNEEFLRFIGSRFGRLDLAERAKTRVLELGCGSGANLWMLAREGFETHGIDLSAEAIKICKLVLESWHVRASLDVADMVHLPYASSSFDLVADVFSAYCLNEVEFDRCLKEIARVTKPGGYFFSYSPSKNSDAFKNHSPASKIDASTLDGILRPSSPFAGNHYPFRFISSAEYAQMLVERGYQVLSNERIGRTYRNGEEYFEFINIAAKKQ
jgi:ubiquinone/menaquinone biosynthesis C-methylase UbiE